MRSALWLVLLLGLLVASAAADPDPVDLLIQGGAVLTMDVRGTVYDDGWVAVRGGRIVAVGAGTPDLPAREVIDARGQAVLPGLVNTHTHVPMTLFRGLADDKELDDWLHNYIFPAEAKNVTADFVTAGSRLAMAEMIRGGTTTFCDMYYFEDRVAEETDRAGLRGVLSQCVLDFPTPDAKTWDAGLAGVGRFVARWKGHPRITPAVGPHAPYTVSEAHLREAAAMAESLDVPLVMHIAEAPGETAYTLKQYGDRPVAFLEGLGFLSPRLIGAHLVQVNADEIETLRRHEVGVASCPQSNMKLCSGVAPVPAMLREGLRVGLGTDGPASNNDLDMWGEMDTAARLHKVVTDDPTVVSAREALTMATLGGARALHLEAEVGSLEPGKRADLILVDLQGAHMVPRYDLYSHMVYAAKAADVTHTIVEGRVLMRDRVVLTVDLQEARRQALRYREQVSRSLQ